MVPLLVIIFVIGYLLIVLEHPLKINKTASALFTAAVLWAVYALMDNDNHHVVSHLQEHLGSVSEILFFLLGAMTIVEIVDMHHGFKIITDKITTRNKRKLLWSIALLTFFLSAILDNLTTSIVMVSLIRKLIQDKEDRLFFAGMIVVAANAGGAWSPIGDVTTTMLWIGGQITAAKIMVQLIIPSLICMIIPLIIVGFKMKGNYPPLKVDPNHTHEVPPGSKTIFFVGVASLIFVPVFKLITHLPPYVGVLFGLGVVWATAELIHRKNESNARKYNPTAALAKVDISSVLFFLGILVAIGTLEATGVLNSFAMQLDKGIGNTDVIVLTIGVLSSIIDNVPLVAASMGMYAMPTQEILDFAIANPSAVVDGVITYTDGLRYYQQDAKLWEFLAYCAGTGGSLLIIGSAAGVAVMGMERIEFFWYIKKITLLAFVGYIAGAFTYLAIYNFMGH